MMKEEAVYKYRNRDGSVAFETVRFEGKKFRQRRYGADGKHIWNLDGVTLLPYRFNEWRFDYHDQWLFIPEGEKDTDRLWKERVAVTTNPLGAGKWRKEYNCEFSGRRVCLLPDNDSVGHAHVKDIATNLLDIAREVKILMFHGLGPTGDVSDWFKTHSRDELLKLADCTSPVTAENVEQWKADKAKVDVKPIPLTVVSKEQAEEIERLKSLKFSPLEQMLEIEEYISQRIDNPYILTAVGYLFNSVVFDVFFACPVLSLSSPDPNCGKTNFLQILYYLDPNGWRVDSPTEAVLFRGIERKYPDITLYTDEAEVLSGEEAKLLQLLYRAGYKKGASISRAERTRGGSFEPKDFTVFCPKIIASIGGVNNALLTRCIQLPMKRSKRLDELIDIDEEEVLEETGPFREILKAYAIQYREKLKDLHSKRPKRVGSWEEFKGRDKELVTGVLTNFRLARIIDEAQNPHSSRGKELEERALEQLRKLTTLRNRTAKAESKLVGRDSEVVEALKGLYPNWENFKGHEFFFPSDLVDPLESMQSQWTTELSKRKDLRAKGAAIGRHISRHDSIRDCKHSNRRESFTGCSYIVKIVLETLLPNTLPELQQLKQSSQLPENTVTSTVLDNNSITTTAETTATETKTPESSDNKGVNGDVLDVLDVQGNSESQNKSFFEDSQNTHIGGGEQGSMSDKEKEELRLWNIARAYEMGKK